MKTKTIDARNLNNAFVEFKWTISKGADTYGYNICSLYINSVKVASCMGGGYDMAGTCLGNWAEKQFEDILAPFAQSFEFEGKYNSSVNGFYGFIIHRDETTGAKKWHLDGATGFECISTIIKHYTAYQLQYIPNLRNGRNSGRYNLVKVF